MSIDPNSVYISILQVYSGFYLSQSLVFVITYKTTGSEFFLIAFCEVTWYLPCVFFLICCFNLILQSATCKIFKIIE